MQETIAKVGYTQSDEITLAWYEPTQSTSDYAFDGRFQKIASVLAGLASARLNWNDFPAFFERGTYVQRRAIERRLTDEERARIPEAHRPPVDATVTRTQIAELELPPLRRIGNLVEVLFEGAAARPPG